jgi:hypothetical protein
MLKNVSRLFIIDTDKVLFARSGNKLGWEVGELGAERNNKSDSVAFEEFNILCRANTGDES